VIKLANLPDVKQPTAAPKPKQEKAQKPEIRLSMRDIAGHKKGQKAPLERLTKEHAAKKAQKTGAGGKKKGPADGKQAETPLGGKDSKRRRPGEHAGKADRGLAGMASARADRQKARKTRGRARSPGARGEDDRDTRPTRRPRTLTRRSGASGP